MTQHTPNRLMEIIKTIKEHDDIVQIMPPAHKQYNQWVHITKHGRPYLILQHRGTKFSISCVRQSRFSKWNYMLRWPYPSDNRQNTIKISSTHFLPTIIKENS